MKTAAQLTTAGQTQAQQASVPGTAPEALQTEAAPATIIAQGEMPGTRALLVISADVQPERQREIAAGRYPRKDYFELAHALQADILDWLSSNDTFTSRLIARVAGKALAQAWLAFRQRRHYHVIYTDSERIGIPLAILLKLARSRKPRHVMLSHLLSPWKKQVWFRRGRIHSHIDTIFCHASLQRQMMMDQLRIPADKIKLIPYQADQHFWKPMTTSEARTALEETPGIPLRAPELPIAGAPADTSDAPLICSVGLEFRDYPTLIEAVRGMEVQVEIAAASYWSHHKKVSDKQALPPNVKISAHQYLSLRQLYAASRFVVVPLLDVPNQAGITVILEAMAMGKAVIVSATRGQTDTLRDRRNHGYGRVERTILPGFLDAPGVPEDLRHLPTGFYVQPGNALELRKAITYLLAHQEVADELGRNGRRVVEELMSLDAFVSRIAQAIQDTENP